MTPGIAAAAPGDAASPFSGTDLCAEAGWRLRAGGRRPVFDDDVWCFGDVDGLAVQLSEGDVRMDFTAICDPRWRLVAKEYLLARMLPGHELVAVLPHAYRIPLALRSCKRRLAELTGWLNWLTASGAGSLSQVSQQHCDRYLHHRRARRDRSGAVLGSVDESVVRLAAAVVIELALYGELFTADAYAPGFRPWDGRSSARVAGMRAPEGNKTPVVRQEVLQPMLAAALYLAGTIGSRIVALGEQVRRQRTPASGHRASVADIAEVLGRHRRHGEPLEAAPPHLARARIARGWDPDDPLLGVSLAALARQAGAGRITPGDLPALRPLITRAMREVGTEKPWGRDAGAVPRADSGEPVPWTLPLLGCPERPVWKSALMATPGHQVGCLVQNIRLAAEAIGLGAWVFCGTFSDLILGGYPDIAKGLGFKYIDRDPAKNPNKVPTSYGLPGLKDAMVVPSPQYPTAESVMKAVYEGRYKPGAHFSKQDNWAVRNGAPYKPEVMEEILNHPKIHYSDWALEAAQKTVEYIVNKWGVCPAFINPVQAQFTAQVHHLDLDFYRKYQTTMDGEGEPYIVTPQIKNHFKTWYKDAPDPYQRHG